jgi:CHC2 zinc finger
MKKNKNPGVRSARIKENDSSDTLIITNKLLIAQVKEEVSILEVLSQYVQTNIDLSKSSRKQFNIRCPFHDDRSPSFTVYTETNTFRCWAGCNQGKPGDVIDLVRLLQNKNTAEAIRTLTIDFSLRTLDTVQEQQLSNRKTEKQRSISLERAFREEVMIYIRELRVIQRTISDYLRTIKTVKDFESKGDLYHVIIQLEYWLDCLIDPDIINQFLALEEIKKYIFKKQASGGGGIKNEIYS